MPEPLSPPELTAREVAALPPYISNGVVGIRYPGLPHLPGTTMVTGFAGRNPDDGVEGFARAPFAIATDVQLDGVWASNAPEWTRIVRQRYDFATAELTTTWEFRVGGATATVESLVFCPRSVPALAACEITVRVDRPADIAIAAGIDPADVPGRGDAHAQPQDQGPNEGVDGRLRWHPPGEVSTLGMAYATAFHGGADRKRETSTRDERGWFSTTFRIRARSDRPYRVTHVSASVPSLSHAQPDEQAGRLAALAATRGFDRLREENRTIWTDLWKGRITIDGADARWQGITDASTYYLLSSVHASSLASTSLFGLAYWPNYHYYHGHVMWDIETFTLPPLLLLQPDAARALLDYRHRHLGAALRNAAIHGLAGAMYPWESCPVHGDEVTPGARPYTEDHVSFDIALAFSSYVHATGDLDYARRFGWPVLRSVAEFAASRVTRTARGFEILDTVGPREYYEPVANNAFTNMAAATMLRQATAIAEALGESPPPLWSQIADKLAIPRDTRRGTILNHDRARLDETQGGVPEGAAGLFPVGYAAGDAAEVATYGYAAREQAPLYAGGPMLSALLPVYAARAGDPALARDLLDPGFGDFINAPYLEPDEYPRDRKDRPRASPMFANLGGYLTGLLYGLTGIRMSLAEPDAWCERPVVLPQGWKGIHVERVWIHGRPWRLDAEAGADRASVVALSA